MRRSMSGGKPYWEIPRLSGRYAVLGPDHSIPARRFKVGMASKRGPRGNFNGLTTRQKRPDIHKQGCVRASRAACIARGAGR